MSSSTPSTAHAFHPSSVLRTLAAVGRFFIHATARRLERRRRYRALAELDEHGLRDVGLTADDVRRARSRAGW